MNLGHSLPHCTDEGERFLSAQLRSISLKMLLPYEVIACDDCSTVSTISILGSYASSAPFSIRVTRNSECICDARNSGKALSASNCEYIALCYQDDAWKPDKLEGLTESTVKLQRSDIYDNFFIDQVKTDWCFKASYKGYQLFATTKVRLRHYMRDNLCFYRLFGHRRISYMSALRHYNIARNSTLLQKRGYAPVSLKSSSQ